MPCNLAVTIAKAAITDEQLLALLTTDLVAQVLTAAMADLGVRMTARVSGNTVSGYAEVNYSDQIAVSITRGVVEVQASSRRRAEEIEAAVGQAIRLLADARYDQEIMAALQALSGQLPTMQSVNVEEQGYVTPAYIYSVSY